MRKHVREMFETATQRFHAAVPNAHITGNGIERTVMPRGELAEMELEILWCERYLSGVGVGVFTKNTPNSYALKHMVERWSVGLGDRQYISNGALIIAALAHVPHYRFRHFVETQVSDWPISDPNLLFGLRWKELK